MNTRLNTAYLGRSPIIPHQFPAYPYADYIRSAGARFLGDVDCCCSKKQLYPVALTSTTDKLSLRHAGMEQSRLMMGQMVSATETKWLKIAALGAIAWLAWRKLR